MTLLSAIVASLWPARQAARVDPVQALLAYDCSANPNHPVRGTARDLWDCLWRAKSCRDVDACIFPGGPAPACVSPGDYTAPAAVGYAHAV